MTDLTCARCDLGVHDGTYLCGDCTKHLARTATRIGEHWAELDTARTGAKAVRYDLPRGTGGKKNPPLPINLAFAPVGPEGEGRGTQAEAATRNTIATWVRVVLETWPSTTPPADHVPACCAFLAGSATAIAGQPWAAELADEIDDTEAALFRLLTTKPPKVFAGRCWVEDEHGRCEAELYARAGQAVIDCPGCGIEHDVAERRDQLLAAASSYAVTASEAAAALAAWTDLADDVTQLRKRIDNWTARGRLHAIGHIDVRGRLRPTYRLGDIQNLLADTIQADQKRMLDHRITRM